MPKRLTFEHVKGFVEKEGYECLSKKYKNAFSKLEFQCSEGHIYEAIWSSFQQGHRCPECAGLKKKTLEEVKEYIEQFGYTCLSKEYKNNNSKLKLQCPAGHTYEVLWCNLQRGDRCPECRKLNVCGSGNPSWKGGVQAEPYCDAWLDQDYKQSIKDRDGIVCLNPYCSSIYKRLVIHHIDYNKKKCHPLNLITLCNSCNSKANKDREWHTAWYSAVLYRRGVIYG